MKPIVDTARTVQSNMTGESVRFGFDPDSITHLQSLLSNLYNDPARAVVRELTMNGIDSTREAGNDKPVQITLPTSLNPVLHVQDFGTGMSLDTLRKVYTNYGASTKRESNEFVGMLGVGSKSPLSLTDSFTVDTVCNGVRIVCAVRKDADGVAEMVILDTETTDAPSGTLISVPVSKPQDIVRATDDFTAFLDEGVVEVDGIEPSKRFRFAINDRVSLVPVSGSHSYTTTDIVVMGGIAYETKGRTLKNYAESNIRVVLTAEIGSLTFTPSREELMDSDNNTRVLAALRGQAAKDVQYFRTHLEEYFDNATEAAKAWKLVGGYNSAELIFDGIKLENTVRMSNGWSIDYSYNQRPRCMSTSSFYADNDRVIPIAGYTGGRLSPTNRRKLAQWAETQGLTSGKRPEFVIFDKVTNPNPVSENMTFYSWDDVAAQKLPSTSRKGGSKGASRSAVWQVWEGDSMSEVETDDLPDDVCFVGTTEWTTSHARLNEAFGLTTVVEGKNRRGRLEKLVNVTDWGQEMKTLLADHYDYMMLCTTMVGGRWHWMANLNIDEIDDELIHRMIELVVLSGTKEAAEYETIRTQAINAGVAHRVETGRSNAYEYVSKLSNKIYRKYQLLGYSPTATSDHITTYLNAIHNEGK